MDIFSSVSVVYFWFGLMFAIALFIWLGFERPSGILGLLVLYLIVMIVCLVVGVVVAVLMVIAIIAFAIFAFLSLMLAYPVVYFFLSILPF